MANFFLSNNRLAFTNEDTREMVISEKQAFSLFADNLRELRRHCGLSLADLAAFLDIPNQTLSSYENKTHTPSFLQALKIATFFHLSIEEFVLCGLDEYPYDATELYEKRKDN